MQHRRLRITTSLLAVLAVVALAACGGSKGGSTSDAAAAARAAGPVPYRPGPYAVGRETISVPSPDNPERVLTVDVLSPADRSQSRGAPASRYQVIPGVEFDSRLARSGLPVSTDGPFPLVVYSHGSGGLRFVSSFLTEVLASHGFVVIAPDHSGNTAIDAAAVYYNTRHFDQARDMLRRATELDPAAPSLWLWTGIVNGGSGRVGSLFKSLESESVFRKDISLPCDFNAFECL